MHTPADNAQAHKPPSLAPPGSRLQHPADAPAPGKWQAMANAAAHTAQLQALHAMAAHSPQAARTAQLQAMANGPAARRQDNATGLPDRLKAGMAALSGISLDDVKLHRNSARPAQLQAHAYAQGSNIYLAPGQERHLPHEAWHVVQQKQGRVRATLQMKGGIGINDSAALEREADVMGAKAWSAASALPPSGMAAPSGAAQRVPMAGAAVAQRVYLHDASGTRYILPSAPIPPGYVRTGMYDDGSHGRDALYQPGASLDASTNPFLAQHGFGKAHVADALIRPDEQVAEPSRKKIDDHYRSRIVKRQDASRQAHLDDVDSSDSESEAGPNPRHQARRRHYKASMLTAISETLHPLNASDEQFREELYKKRKLNNDAQSGNRQMYTKTTRTMFAQVGEQFKRTSFRHNPYYRRAFRRAVSGDKVKAGGSDAYTQAQARIRTELQKEIAQDALKMQWRKEDFPNAQVWADIQFMQKSVLSNASKGDTYHGRTESAQDTAGSEARIGFHHVAWKEAESGAFTPYALNPANLTGLNDMRDILNPKKLEKIKAAGGKPPAVGAHDAFGHQGAGFKASDKAAFERAKGGGQFKDIDLEATDQILEPLLEDRTKKRKLYQVDDAATPPAKQPVADVVHLAAAVTQIAQQLLAAIPGPQGNAGDHARLAFGQMVQAVAQAAGLVDTTDAANVATLLALHRDLNLRFRYFRTLVRRNAPVWVPAGNALGAEGERIPALAQFFAECGQMAAHNALVMAEFPLLAQPPARLDEARLNQLGSLENNITETQIRTIIGTAGRRDIPVFGNITQMGTIVQLLRQGNYHTLAQYQIGAQEQWGAYHLARFMDGHTGSLVAVVNTDSHQDAKAPGHHWITVRFTRQPDGQIAIHYLDSLVAPADYRQLFHTLRVFLNHVPAQAAVAQGPGTGTGAV